MKRSQPDVWTELCAPCEFARTIVQENEQRRAAIRSSACNRRHDERKPLRSRALLHAL